MWRRLVIAAGLVVIGLGAKTGTARAGQCNNFTACETECPFPLESWCNTQGGGGCLVDDANSQCNFDSGCPSFEDVTCIYEQIG